MRRALILVPLFLFGLPGLPLPASADPTAPAVRSGFDGVWVGEIIAPDKRAELGLAFTRTEQGLLVSVHLPAMFIHGANFGAADIRAGRFTLAPLNLAVALEGDRLAGSFAAASLPVELRRGESFPAAPPEREFPAAPVPAWSRPLGAGAWASPAAYAGTLYIGTVDGKLRAVRAADGAEIWTWTGPYPLYGDPLATEDAVYFVDDRCDLVALARIDGTLRWRLPLHDERHRSATPPRDETFNHRTASPAIDAKGILYVGSTDGGLYAIKAKTGRTLWRHEAGARMYAPVALHGDELVAGCFDGSVFVLNRRTRRETMRTKPGGPIVSAPAIAADRIVVGARDAMLRGLNRSGQVAWADSFWFSWVESTPRLAGDRIYVGGSDYRRVSALDPATGREFWAADVGGLSWGSPVVVADTVFAGAAGQPIAGTVIEHTGGIVALDRDTGTVKWRYTAPPASGAGFNGFAGSLVWVDGLIVGASVEGTLIALPASAAPQPARKI